MKLFIPVKLTEISKSGILHHFVMKHLPKIYGGDTPRANEGLCWSLNFCLNVLSHGNKS